MLRKTAPGKRFHTDDLAVSAFDDEKMPADAPQTETAEQDVSVAEGLTWTQKIIGIVAVVALCYTFVRYHSNKPQSQGYEKTQA